MNDDWLFGTIEEMEAYYAKNEGQSALRRIRALKAKYQSELLPKQ